MASTSEMRAAWAPACDSGGMQTIDFGNAGARITIDRITVPIWRAVESILAKYRYTIRRADTGAYNCRQITGGSGYSLHAYGIAVDINWQSNPYSSRLITDMPPGAIREIEALNVAGRPVLRWGGRYSGNKDAMHFEVIVPPSVAARFTYQGEDELADAKDEIIASVQNQGKLGREVTQAQTTEIDRKLKQLEDRLKAQSRKLDELMEKVSALG